MLIYSFICKFLQQRRDNPHSLFSLFSSYPFSLLHLWDKLLSWNISLNSVTQSSSHFCVNTQMEHSVWLLTQSDIFRPGNYISAWVKLTREKTARMSVIYESTAPQCYILLTNYGSLLRCDLISANVLITRRNHSSAANAGCDSAIQMCTFSKAQSFWLSAHFPGTTGGKDELQYMWFSHRFVTIEICEEPEIHSYKTATSESSQRLSPRLVRLDATLQCIQHMCSLAVKTQWIHSLLQLIWRKHGFL